VDISGKMWNQFVTWLIKWGEELGKRMDESVYLGKVLPSYSQVGG